MKIISYTLNKEFRFGMMTSKSTFIDISEILKTDNILDFIENFSRYENLINSMNFNTLQEINT